MSKKVVGPCPVCKENLYPMNIGFRIFLNTELTGFLLSAVKEQWEPQFSQELITVSLFCLHCKTFLNDPDYPAHNILASPELEQLIISRYFQKLNEAKNQSERTAF